MRYELSNAHQRAATRDANLSELAEMNDRLVGGGGGGINFC